MTKEDDIKDTKINKLSIKTTGIGANLFLDGLKLENVYSFNLSTDAEDPFHGVLSLSLRVRL